MNRPSPYRILSSVLLKLGIVISAALAAAGCATMSPQSSATSPTTSETSPIIGESMKDLGIASPHSLLQAENMLGESTAGYSNTGLELSYVAYKMIQILYPAYLKPEFVIFPPTASIYPTLFGEVQKGTFPTVSQSDVSFLTLIIPPMAALYSDRPDVLDSSMEALDHAETLNPNSVLPPYLKGYIYEKRGQSAKAILSYNRALSVDSTCYPAAIGKARILLSEKRYADANAILTELSPTIPPDATVFHLEAEAELAIGSYSAAGKAIARALEIGPQSPEKLVLAAKIYEAQKDYAKALTELAKAESMGPPTPEMILMRARLEQESGNQSAALATLAAGVKRFPENQAIAGAYGKILIESGNAGEGGKYLSQTGTQQLTGSDSLELLVTDAIDSKDWKSAEAYISKLLLLRSDQQTWHQAYVIYHALDDNAKVAEFARRLYTAAPDNTEYLFDYIQSLTTLGKDDQARKTIDDNLKQQRAPSTMSTLYYLRSQIQTNPAARLADLRSALLENLENEKALVAIARFYLQTGDVESARRYAQQAASFLGQSEKLPEDLEKLLASGG